MIIRYPANGGSVPIYATASQFPATNIDGEVVIAADTDILYAYNAGMAAYVVIGGPGGVLSIGTIDSQTASTNGAVIASNALYMQSASATRPGLVNNTTQSFSGNKTFTGTIGASNLSGTNTGDVTLGTNNGLSIVGQILSLQAASTSLTGALTSTDWNTFNNKQAALTIGNLTESTSSVLTITGGTGAIIGPGLTIQVALASTLLSGYLSSTDWNTFNNKQASGNYITALTGGVTASGPGSATAIVVTVGGSTAAAVNTATVLVNTAQSGNKVLASPSNGSSAAPAFRSLVGADLPNPSASSLGGIQSYAAVSNQWINTISTSGVPSSSQPAFSNISGTANIGQGGTGQVTQAAAFNALSPMTSTGDIIYDSSAANAARLAIGSTGNILTVAGGVPVWAAPATSGTVTSVAMTVPSFLSVSGSPITSAGTLAVSLSGTALPLANGGTGQTTKAAAFDALSPMTTLGDIIYGGASGTGTRLAASTNGFVLTLAAGIPSWAAAGTVSPLSTKGDLYGYSSVNARIPVGVDGQRVMADSNATLGVRYQDEFPKNYILNSDAEVDTAGWATYADAAQNIPVDGTGGTATNLTFSRSTSSPLDGVGSFSMVQANSTSLQGKGVSYAFSIDSADQTRALAIQFNFNASSTFIASNGITPPLNDGTVTTNAGNSDIEVFVYDVTNSVLIYVSPQTITANGTNNFQFKGVFQSSPSSTSYRLILHIATASANATGWTFKFDQVFVGSLPVCYGPPVTDWGVNPWTPTGSFTTNTTYTGKWRRVGDSVQAQFHLAFAGAPNSTTCTVNLPSGLVIDTAKLTVGAVTDSSYLFACGGIIVDNGSNFYPVQILPINTTSVILRYLHDLGAGTATAGAFSVTQVAPFTIGNLDSIDAYFQVPIVGWSSTTLMSSDTNTQVIATIANGQPANVTSGNPIIFPTVIQSSTGTYNSSTGQYTCSVAGFYRTTVSVSAATLTDGTALDVFKNGAISSRLGAAAQTNGSAWGCGLTSCVPGDILTVVPDTNISSFSATAARNTVSFVKESGPSTIAASDPVNARYFASATTISGSLATIVWTTKDYDSFLGMSSGLYTVPISGKYQVNSAVAIAGTFALNNLNAIEIQKNSVAVSNCSRYSAALVTNELMQISDEINCNAGDILRIQVSSAATLPTIVSSNTRNFISIFRTGN